MARMVDVDTIAEVLGELEELVDKAGLDDHGVLARAIDRVSAATVEAYTVDDIAGAAMEYIERVAKAFDRRVVECRDDEAGKARLRDHLESYLNGMRALAQHLRVWIRLAPVSPGRCEDRALREAI